MIVLTAAAVALVPAGAVAAPPSSQSTTSSSVQRTSAFVCPVISTDSVLNAKNGEALGTTGDYTVSGPTRHNGVPINATNGDGTGVPAGAHSSPGDTDYSAIWSTC